MSNFNDWLCSLGTRPNAFSLGRRIRPWNTRSPRSPQLTNQSLDPPFVTTIDTANVYSNGISEEIVGNAIKKYQLDRDRLVIATKVYNPVFPGTQPRIRMSDGVPQSLNEVNRGGPGGLSRKAIFQEVDASLKRLDMACIDLYQIHRYGSCFA